MVVNLNLAGDVMEGEIDGLSIMRWLDGEARRRISECESEIRALSNFLERVGPVLGSPDSIFISKLQLRAGSVPEMTPVSPSTTVGDGYFGEMRRLLPALRSAKGHLPRLHLLAVAGGGKLNLNEAADFMLGERISEAKDLETLVKNLGTSINKDGAFVPDPDERRTYYLRSMRQPPSREAYAPAEALEIQDGCASLVEIPELLTSLVDSAEPSRDGDF